MNSDRLRRLQELYHAVLERAPEERAAFLREAAAGDEELRAGVESLLGQSKAGILDRPGPVDEGPLKPGTRLGPYQVVETIGAGGMGTVYKAEDTRLGRTVAIKLLRPGGASSPEMRQRFEREARAISALNHPHICAVYDVGSQDGAEYLVMEHLEGETLAARLRKGPLPWAPAMAIAVQVADALGAAHGKGIVHRDLKPENIMLTAAGPKILDFGLAKTAPAAVQIGESTRTQTQPLTTGGAIIGTLPYMAPEQVEGKECDQRTDIFAFGLVLYEMVTGRRAFARDTKAGLIAAVIASDPDFRALQTVAPPQFERVLRGCLEKEPAKRWQSIVDVKRLLEWPAGLPPESAVAGGRGRWWPWALAVAAIAAFTVMASLYLRRADAPAPIKFSLSLSDYAGGLIVSPDGFQVAYLARNAAGVHSLWVHRLDKGSSVALAGTDDAQSPFWSADGRWIGFYSDGKLSKIHPPDGRPQKIADVPSLSKAAWGATGDIVFAPSQRSPLYHLRESGGAPRQITTLNDSRTENSHRAPVFLPDGKHFLFTARCTNREYNALYLGSLEPNTSVPIAAIQSNAQYVPARAGHSAAILYARDGVLVSQDFDGKRLAGEATTVVNAISYAPSSSSAVFETSENGRVLVYVPSGAGGGTLSWYDRSGNKTGELGPPGAYTQPRISPDGSRVVFSRPDSRTGNRDIWTIDIASGATARLTTNAANDWWPVWSPDGKQILFGSDRQGGSGMKPFLKTALEAGLGEAPLETNFPVPDLSPTDWSRTGWMAFDGTPKTNRPELWVMNASQGKAFQFLKSESRDSVPRFSPDGKWIAYVSDETGRSEVYIRPFQGGPAASGGRIQISTGGGDFPAWNRTGEDLFYISADLNLKQLDLRPPGPGRAAAATLFKVCSGTGLNASPGTGTFWEHPFDVAPDGRFLFNCRAEPGGRFVVWMNWLAAKSEVPQ
jgi:serine/threonine protein kinase